MIWSLLPCCSAPCLFEINYSRAWINGVSFCVVFVQRVQLALGWSFSARRLDTARMQPAAETGGSEWAPPHSVLSNDLCASRFQLFVYTAILVLLLCCSPLVVIGDGAAPALHYTFNMNNIRVQFKAGRERERDAFALLLHSLNCSPKHKSEEGL